MKKKLVLTVVLAVAVCPSMFAQEQDAPEENIWHRLETGDTDDPDASIDRKLLPLKAGPFDIGGFFRYNYTIKNWTDTYEGCGEFDLDTVAVHIDLEGLDPFTGSFQYRYYHDHFGRGHEYHFLHHGWLGYKLNDTDEIRAGVHQVPFGIVPFASHNWFFQLPYYVGLEDDYDLGVKYMMERDNWSHQFAYYAMDEGNYFGDSPDSSRYSYDVVEASADWDGFESHNDEHNQFNYRGAYTFDHGDTGSTEVGGSIQWSQIQNDGGGDDGSHYAAAAHVNGNYGPYNVMGEIIRYEYAGIDNPAGDNFIAMGAYDFAYKVATRGYMYCLGVSREFPVELGPITAFTLYNDWGILVKDEEDWGATQHNVAGVMISAGRFLTFVDFAFGQNHPWIGPGWTNALTSGAPENDWYTRFNVNVGYYF